ncbi:tetratricopeptide repeat protein [Polynucleobacter paneuropaeus]|nr:tetratricopeptide repeat protein [Polynucleobacter paneuropaeus]
MNPKIQFLLAHAIDCLQSQKYAEAILWLKQASKIQPKNFNILRLLGVAEASLKNYSSAIKYFQLALVENSKSGLIYSNLGNIYQELDRFEEAIVEYEKAIKLQPEYFEAYSNKGNTLQKLDRFEEAIVEYEKALTLNIHFAEAWSNKGYTFSQLKYFEEAIQCYDRALSLRPGYAEAWLNKGYTFSQLKYFEEAIQCYDRALSLRPGYAEAWSGKGVCFFELKDYPESLECSEKARKLNPSIDFLLGQIIHTKMKICLWDDLDGDIETTLALVQKGARAATPFALLPICSSEQINSRASEIWAQYQSGRKSSPIDFLKREKNQKIRLGYFSADFHDHATSHLMAGLFESHDKKHFELVAFSFGPNKIDLNRQRLSRAFDQFLDVSKLTSSEIASMSRELGIDIAIDLKGYTEDGRSDIFHYRAAPIQVSYLGYPGTVGSETIDYILADKVVIPPENHKFYPEKVVNLPYCYQVNDDSREVPSSKYTRSAMGLPDNAFVFCCFNNSYKITPTVFAIWMKILQEVEGSVLWILEDNKFAAENLHRYANMYDIDPCRIIFCKRLPHEDHLSRHHCADLFLDTFPCNAHTTTSDALWMGLPVVTYLGTTFAGRVAASLLNAVGLEELVTTSDEDYQKIAIELAINSQKLASLKERLAINKFNKPLFNTNLSREKIEEAYLEMYSRYRQGLMPSSFDVLA